MAYEGDSAMGDELDDLERDECAQIDQQSVKVAVYKPSLPTVLHTQ